MPTPQSAERTPSVWEDLLEIFYAPKAVFERRRDTPAFGLALIVFAVLIVGLSFAFKGMMEPVFEAEYKRGMVQALKDNPNLTEAQMMQGKEIAKKFIVVGVAVFAIFAPLILGLLLWLVGKFVGSKAEVGQTMMVAVYGLFPRVLEAIVNAAQTVIVPEESITSRYSLTLGPGRFLDANTSNPLLLAMVGRLDLFTLWITVLFAIGLAVVGRISYSRAAVAGVVMWLIGALPGVWQAVRAM
jgi:hypothetical protein